jgi:transglutaminase-like putative cysteine protease
MRGRALAGLAVLVAWVAGLGMLVRREYFRPHIDRLAEAALRVQPGAVFYAVMQGNEQIGFASSTIDTALTNIEQRDYLVADIPIGGRLHRTTARTNVILTRTLRVRSFEFAMDADSTPVNIKGTVLGDTLLELVTAAGIGAPGDTQRVVISGPILLPTLAPLAVALDAEPEVGKSYTLPIFDPATMAPKDVRIEVRAETLFVVNDSSVFDSTSMRWTEVRPDTVRAWQLVSESGTGIGGWVDQQGRIVSSTQMGFRLQRRPYEVAFENWRLDTEGRPVATPATPASRRTVPANRDVLETSAIAANRRIRSNLGSLRVRLSGPSFAGFDLDGGRQRFENGILTVTREAPEMMLARYRTIVDGPLVNSRPELRPEAFVESNHPEIVALAQRIARGSRDPRVVAMRINEWVHDSVRKEVTIGIPSALHVYHTRRGDCNEHAQLFVAIARAGGIPARVASGLAYVDGKFYYHAWPEVMLRGWVAVDPTFGQFPADASHLRFVTGGLGRQAELLRLVGGLSIDVVNTR